MMNFIVCFDFNLEFKIFTPLDTKINLKLNKVLLLTRFAIKSNVLLVKIMLILILAYLCK